MMPNEYSLVVYQWFTGLLEAQTNNNTVLLRTETHEISFFILSIKCFTRVRLVRIFWWSFAKNHCPYAYICTTHGNGFLKVARHSHAQFQVARL